MSPHPADLARMRAEVAALSDAVTARFNGLLASHRTQGGVLPAGLATAAAEIRRVHGEVGRFLAAPQVDPDGDARVMTTLIDVQRRTLALLAEIERSTTSGGPAPRAAPPQPQPPMPAAPAPQTARPPLLPWQQEPPAAPPAHPSPTQPRAPQSQRPPTPQTPQFDAYPQGQPGALPAGYHQAASPQAPLAPQTQGRPAPQFQAVAPAADPRTVDPRTAAPRTAPPAPQTRPTAPPQQRPAQQQTGVPPTGWPTAPHQQPRAEPQPFRAGPGQQGMSQQPYPAAPQHQVGQHQNGQHQAGPHPAVQPQGGQPYTHSGAPGAQPSPAYAQQMLPQAAPPAFDPVRAGYGNLVNAHAHDDDAHHEETSAPPSRRLSRRTWILSATAVLAIVAITGVYLAGPRLGRVVALVRGTPAATKSVTKSADAGKKSGAIPAVAKADATASGGAGDAFIPVLATYADYSAARQAFVALKQRYPDLLGGTAPDIETVTVPDGGTWHRLGVLPALPRAQAQDLCQQLQTAGHTGCWVRPQG